MLIFNNRTARNRGDTLIEVLFAVSVFSLVAVGSLSIMNQGTATAQRSLEITLVRQQIDSQAEALRFLNASYVAAYPNVDALDGSLANQWLSIQGSIQPGKADPITGGAICPTFAPIGSFILNTKSTDDTEPRFKNVGGSPNSYFQPATSFSQVRYKADNTVDHADGIWIEAVLDTSNKAQTHADYIDFHISACWDSPGQSTPMTIGTIVRLYEPSA